jgi:hypothetical protein
MQGPHDMWNANLANLEILKIWRFCFPPPAPPPKAKKRTKKYIYKEKTNCWVPQDWEIGYDFID